MSELQLQFPFPSLDFEGYPVLRLDDIANRLRVTHQHVRNEIDAGTLSAIDLRGEGSFRARMRIPLETYHTWILRRLTAPHDRQKFFRNLPRDTRVQLIRELRASLDAEQT